MRDLTIASWSNSRTTQLKINAPEGLPFFYFSKKILETLFHWYTTNSTLSTSTTCIPSNTFYNSSIKFFGSSLTLELVKFWGFILKNSWILEASATPYHFSLFLPNIICHNLAQHLDSFIELNIDDLCLGLRFWCIRYSLFLDIPPSKTTFENSSYMHDLKDTHKHKL